MQIEVKIDPACTEPKVILCTSQMTDECSAILQALSAPVPEALPGFQGDTMTLLRPEAIIRVYTAAGKLFAVTGEGEFQLRLRLYEAEQRLQAAPFARISQSELINLNQVKGFDLSLAGTICVRFLDGSTTYVSRRYVSKLKQRFGL